MKLRLIVLLVLLPTLVTAQQATTYTFKVFNQGATSPITTTTLPAGSFLCGQPKAVVLATQHNPTTIQFNDPADVALDCKYADTGTGPLLSLPFGTQVYVSTLSATNAAGTSLDSGTSNPFDRAETVPPVPANVRVK